MLRCHVTTDDLLRYDNALNYQKFKTPSGNTAPYAHDKCSIVEGSTAGTYELTSDTAVFDETFIGETINLPSLCFLVVLSYTDATTVICELDQSLKTIINYYDEDFTLAEAEGVAYSVGGYEDKIKDAYKTMLLDLQDKDINYTSILDKDNIYAEVIRAKAISISHQALARADGDLHDVKSRYFEQMYERLKSARIPRISGETKAIASRKWGRSS